MFYLGLGYSKIRQKTVKCLISFATDCSAVRCTLSCKDAEFYTTQETAARKIFDFDDGIIGAKYSTYTPDSAPAPGKAESGDFGMRFHGMAEWQTGPQKQSGSACRFRNHESGHL